MREYAGLWPETPYDGSKGSFLQSRPRAAYAAMVTRLDRTAGRIVTLLRELGLEPDTLVLFSSDKGTAQEDGAGIEITRIVER